MDLTSSTAQRRMQVIFSHLKENDCSFTNHSNEANFISENCSHEFAPKKKIMSVDVSGLRKIWDQVESNTRNETRHILESTPEFKECPEMEYRQFRNTTHNWVKTTLKKRPVSLFDLRDDPARYFAFLETLGFFNQNLSVKLAVQWGLFGGCLLLLGTKRHAHLIPKAESGEVMGCFGMTELGHGSNVQKVETTATYDPKTSEFIVHSPTRSATKFWIGNAANYAHFCVVFAQLIIKGEKKGVHAFLTPIRDLHGNVCRGVTIEDCGHKQGLNGVDNGAISFDHVRISREKLLNRFSDVTPQGEYVSKFSSPGRNFAATVGALTSGRVLIGLLSVSTAKVGLAIAIRYGNHRRQFGPSSKPESFIASYPTFYNRLMPLLATTIGYDLLGKEVAKSYASKNGTATAHYMSAALKAFSSWHMTEALNVARMCCGGQGYRSYAKIPTLLADTHVFNTFEGDSIVLAQQVTRYLFSEFNKQQKVNKFEGVFEYLNNQTMKMHPIQSNQPKESLRDTNWIISMFQQREYSLILELQDGLNKQRATQVDQFTAWNNCQMEIHRVAQAHTERLIMELFADYIRNASYSVQPTLQLLHQLCGVRFLHQDLGWFTTHDVIPHSHAKLVESVLQDLCADVNSIAMDIVESFGIPESCLPRDPELMEF
eukprot:gb/GECH01012191.1/.p1 GENE.gb/GECH01012191.1/~~gb/GECH01012191.1/.p1  ORF type:complete len:657 (+),score=135.65 gb/GECH01012191.1/:1-1971(+)